MLITISVYSGYNLNVMKNHIILQTIEIETFMMLHKYSQNRIFNLAILVLPKLYSGYFCLSNLPNTDDLFRHSYMSPISHMKQRLGDST